MKYKLVIDKQAEEEVIAIVHAPSTLTQQIENLVCSFSGADSIMGYMDDEIRKLDFRDIECITVLDRKVIAIDRSGTRFSLKARLRDLEGILPSYFIRINKSKSSIQVTDFPCKPKTSSPMNNSSMIRIAVI